MIAPARAQLAALLAAIGLTLIGAASATAATTTVETARGSGLTATFSYRGSGIDVSHAHLRIVRGGRVAYDAAVRAHLCGTLCGPAAFGPRPQAVRIIRLIAGGQPDVVLSLFSGGANCCFIDQVFSYRASIHGYVKSERDFGSAGAAVQRLGAARRWRFVSADDAFKYAFTDGADSGEPLQILSFTDRGFVDVTRRYPSLISSDARRWWRLYTHHLSNGVGLIAAWAADEELLGHDHQVQSTLATEARRGNLRDGGQGLATGRQFVAQLNALLTKLGYRH